MLIDFFRFNQTAGGGIAFAINAFLLLIIINCPSRDIGPYRYLLFAYTLTATLLSFITCSTAPMFLGGSGGIVFYSTVPRIPYEVGNWLLIAYSNCYAQISLILTLSFVYRYKFVYSSYRDDWMFTSKLPFFLGFSMIVVVFLYGIPASYSYPNDYLISINNATIFTITGYSDTVLSTIGGPPFVDGKPTSMLACFVMYVCGVLICMVIILHCVIRLNKWFGFHSSENISDRTRRLQKRFYVLLILQTISPLVFTYAPLLICFPLGLLKVDIPANIHVVYSSFLPFAQICEPLLVFGFIKEYRSAVRRWLGMTEATVAPQTVSYTDVIS